MDESEIISIKSKKIHDLQLQAIVGQIRKIVQEEKIDFLIEEDSIQFKLCLKISEREYLELRIPRKKFKEIVPNLQTMIQSLLTWHKMGLKVKDLQIIPSARSSNRKWTKYSTV